MAQATTLAERSDQGLQAGASSSASSASMAQNGYDAEPLAFTCGCSNVHINGTLQIRSESAGEGDEQLEQLWLGAGSENAKHSIYVGYDAPDPVRPSRRPSSTDRDDAFQDDTEEVWRICWLCETKLYRVKGKRKEDPPVENGTVAVDRMSVIVVGAPGRGRRKSSNNLPYSNLNLPVPSTSHFGRPPQDSLPAIYPPVGHPSSSSRAPTYLPRVPDPFFLPPPFIPSHPHLRDLCTRAVEYLNARHRLSEDEVRNFIDIKAREMRELQEVVRAEVEVLWDKYAQGPGRKEVQERERRRSESVSGSMDRKGVHRDRERSRSRTQSAFSPAMEQPSENPILREVALQANQNGTSLLSASISQNQYIPQPASIPDEVDDSIEEVARAVDKKGDQRAVAMSYVFSTLDTAMATSSGKSTAIEDDAQPEEPKNTHGKDSWIDQERLAGMYGAGASTLAEQGGGGEGRTPRARTVKELDSPAKERKGSLLAEGAKASKEKGKVKVSFAEEDKPDSKEILAGADMEAVKGQEDDDYVFDFELEDREPAAVAEAVLSTSAPGPSDEMKRLKNTVEQTLASTYASHAPSHRAANLRYQIGRSSIYPPLRRRDSGDELDSDSSSSAIDETSISKLATSVPVAIALPGRKSAGAGAIHPYERKTSLSDKEGILVPPLIKAMRQRGIIADGNSLGLSSSPTQTPTPRPQAQMQPGSRSASTTRKGNKDSEDQEDDGDAVGTLRENRFVPPHVLARKESLQSKDVGWRSMISD